MSVKRLLLVWILCRVRSAGGSAGRTGVVLIWPDNMNQMNEAQSPMAPEHLTNHLRASPLVLLHGTRMFWKKPREEVLLSSRNRTFTSTSKDQLQNQFCLWCPSGTFRCEETSATPWGHLDSTDPGPRITPHPPAQMVQSTRGLDGACDESDSPPTDSSRGPVLTCWSWQGEDLAWAKVCRISFRRGESYEEGRGQGRWRWVPVGQKGKRNTTGSNWIRTSNQLQRRRPVQTQAQVLIRSSPPRIQTFLWACELVRINGSVRIFTSLCWTS